MEYRDYYKILGVPRTASQGEIKKAYRRLARQNHPDVKPGDTSAEQRFKDLNEANAVLGDPAKRRQYDELGASWESLGRAGAGTGARGGQAAGPFGGSGNVRYEFRTSSGEDIGGFSDFFRMMFGGADPDGPRPATEGARAAPSRARGGSPGGGSTGDGSFEDILAQMGIDGAAVGRGAGPGAGTPRTRQPAVVEAAAELTLEEAFHGTSRLVEVDGKRLEVTIPRGVDTGSRIRLTGKGGEGADLVVSVRVRPHAVFTRRGADLERELPLTLEEALLGAAVPVGTLKGRVELTVPPGTQNGRTFRLTGQGMPRYRDTGNGDLYVRTRVVLPTALSGEAKAAARRFLELADQPNPRQTQMT